MKRSVIVIALLTVVAAGMLLGQAPGGGQGRGGGGWAGFSYVIEGTNQVKGTNTMVFKTTASDWQIVLIHGAVDTPAVPH